MNRQILNKLLLCALLLNVVTPTLSAAEMNREILNDEGAAIEVTTNESEVSSEVTDESEVSSEVTDESEVSSEVTESEVSSEIVDESEVSSEATDESEVSSEIVDESEVSSEIVDESEVSSEATDESEVVSEGSEVGTDETATLGDDFYIFDTLEYDTEITELGQKIDGGFEVNPAVDSNIKSGATFELENTSAFSFSNLELTTGQTKEQATELIEGEDYTVNGTTITLTTDIVENESVFVSYQVSIENGTTDVLGAESDSMYNDLNDNGKFDGDDYYESSVGYNLVVTNGSVTETDDIIFDASIKGGELAITDEKVNDSFLKDDEAGINATFTVENTGDYAISYSSMSLYSMIGTNDATTAAWNDEYEMNEERFMAVYSDEEYSATINGSEVTDYDSLRASANTTADRYLNPGESLDVNVDYSFDDVDLELAVSDFGSIANAVNSSEVVLTVSYGANVFDVYASDEIEDVLPLATEIETTIDTTTDTDDTATDTDDGYIPMELDDSDSTLATTGSTLVLSIITLTSVLVVAFIAKFRIINK